MSEELSKDVQQNTTNIALLTLKMDTTLEKIDTLCDTISESNEQNQKTFKGIDDALRGKDSENPGLFVRMDRQEKFAERTKKQARTIIGMLGTTIGGIVVAFFSWLISWFQKGT